MTAFVDKDEFKAFADYTLLMVRNEFAAQGVTLPARQYITVGGRGEVPHDTEQMTLTLEQINAGFPGITQTTGMHEYDARTILFVVEVVRQIPIPGDDQVANQSTSTSKFDRIKAEISAGQKPEQISPLDLLDPDSLTNFAYTQMEDMACLYSAGMAVAAGYNQGVSIDVQAGPPSGAFQGTVMTIGMTPTGLIPV